MPLATALSKARFASGTRPITYITTWDTTHLCAVVRARSVCGRSPADAHRLLTHLEAIKDNVRNAIQNTPDEPARKEQHYG